MAGTEAREDIVQLHVAAYGADTVIAHVLVDGEGAETARTATVDPEAGQN